MDHRQFYSGRLGKYSQPKNSFGLYREEIRSWNLSHSPRLTMTFILCLLAFLPKILAGFIIAHLLWKDFDFPAILLKLSIGVPLGLAISASLFFIAVLMGVSPRT